METINQTSTIPKLPITYLGQNINNNELNLKTKLSKEEFENIAIISETESDILPYIPTLRKECFNSLSNEAQCFVLRANLAGLNVTANGQNGLPFLYMAPTTEIQREHMRSQLEKLEQTMAETLSHGGNTHYSSQAEQNHTAHNSIQKY